MTTLQQLQAEFKTLMYCGNYVDANLLEKGIYTCQKPFIYHSHETISSLIKQAEDIQDKMGKHHISDKYIDNLKQCELVSIIITIKNNQ